MEDSVRTAKVWSSFAFEFVVGDFTLQSQPISNNKIQKAKDRHSRATQISEVKAVAHRSSPHFIVLTSIPADNKDAARKPQWRWESEPKIDY